MWAASPSEAAVGMAAGDTARLAETHLVSPQFFRTLRIGVLEGREIAESDDERAAPVAVVSSALARVLAPSGGVVGRTMYARGKAFEIIGVVPDYRIRMAGEPVPLLAFFAFSQNALGPESDARFAVRVRGDPGRVLPTLERSVESVDGRVPVAEVMTLPQQIDAKYPQIRLGQTVLLATSALALLLTSIGIYGLVAFLVTRGRRDIGIRIALGARPGRVAAQYMRSAVRAVAAGIGAGAAGAWLLGTLLNSWLVGVTAHDPFAFGITAVVVFATAMLACLVPARRAARVDPATALRME